MKNYEASVKDTPDHEAFQLDSYLELARSLHLQLMASKEWIHVTNCSNGGDTHPRRFREGDHVFVIATTLSRRSSNNLQNPRCQFWFLPFKRMYLSITFVPLEN